MRQRLILAAVLVGALLAGGAAPAQDFTWSGWFGPDYTDPAWGGHWTWDNQLMENGWGHQWWWWEEPEPHFPGPASWVLIPDGFVVDTYGGSFPYCGRLTVAPQAVLQIVYDNLFISGPVVQNDGLIELIAGGGSVSGFLMSAPLSLEGDGEIRLAPGRFHSEAAAMALSVGAGQLIHGYGQFGSEPYGNYHGIDLTNHGVIRATSPTSVLDILGLDVVNRGTVEAAGEAMLRIWGDWDNAGGEILASGTGRVLLAGGSGHPARIEGGVLRTTEDGEIWPDDHGSLKNLTNEGLLHLRRYTEVHMSDVIVNEGVINQGNEGNAGWATIKVDSALTFTGGGVLEMGAANAIQMPEWPTGPACVTNGPQHTIESYGGAFGVLPNDYGDQRIELVNEGTLICLESSYATAFRVSGAGFENRGTLILGLDSDQDHGLWGDFRQTSGTLICDDRWVQHEGAGFVFSGGVLAGHGGLQGPVITAETTLHPGRDGEIGSLDIYGPLTANHGTTLVCEWAHNQKDRLAVHGLFSSTGTVRLRVVFVELGGAPEKGADFTVLVCDEVDDQATWELELPEGWSCDALEWVDGALVVRGMTGMPTAAPQTPAALVLHGAAPNPFNPRTTLRFSTAQDGPVRLWLADLAGRRVRTLVQEVRPAGEHAVIWNGDDDRGLAVSSGTYLAVLEAAGERRAARLTLVR